MCALDSQRIGGACVGRREERVVHVLMIPRVGASVLVLLRSYRILYCGRFFSERGIENNKISTVYERVARPQTT